MARIKLANMIVAISGKIAGTVYAKNAGGDYARTWVKPTNPKSTAQLLVRNRLTSLSQAWRGLSASQRDAWSAACANFLRTNVFGDAKKLKGNALFVSLNKNLGDIGVASVSTPPTPVAVGYLTALSGVADNSSNSLVLTYTAVNDTAVAYKVFATPALSPGKNVAGSDFRQIGYTGTAEASPFTATSLYTAVFGAIGAVGQKIFVKMVPVNITNGQAGAEISCEITIQA